MIKIPPPLADRLPEVQAFRDSLDLETDRGCAIIAASYVDDQLAEMLKAHFVESKRLIKEVFSGSGALSTFSPRIDMSFLSGHISKAVQRELHLIRGIRNKFATLLILCRSQSLRSNNNAELWLTLIIRSRASLAKRPSVRADLKPTEAHKEKVRKAARKRFATDRSKNI